MNLPSTELAPRAIAEPLSLDGVLRHVKLVQQIMKEVMIEGVHYGGAYPGDTKKSLLKPGAEKLLFTFRLGSTQEVQIVEMASDHREYRIKTTLRAQDGNIVAEGLGSCCTKETKYRYRNSGLKCPTCQKETVIKGKDEYGGGWLCHSKRGGCGAKWPDGAAAIEGQQRGKVDNPDIADVYNTVLKMASKRSLVAATILATAAGDIFSQDADDLEAKSEPVKQSPTPKTPPQRFVEACNAIRAAMGDVPGDSMIDHVRAKHNADGDKATQANKLAALEELEKLAATGEVAAASLDGVPF